MRAIGRALATVVTNLALVTAASASLIGTRV